jgi:hypothetical protein
MTGMPSGNPRSRPCSILPGKHSKKSNTAARLRSVISCRAGVPGADLGGNPFTGMATCAAPERVI